MSKANRIIEEVLGLDAEDAAPLLAAMLRRAMEVLDDAADYFDRYSAPDCSCTPCELGGKAIREIEAMAEGMTL